ncbi:MAG TPA: hypothetical protein VGK05_06495 [Acidimicrobiia bacterium]
MKRAEPGWLVLALAGVAAAIGSSLPFYTFGGDIELTVWHRTLFPTATLIPLLIFAFGLEALFVLLMGREPRSPFLNFTWSQARLAGSAFAILLTLCYLVQGRAGGSLGTGYLILSLSALAAFGGAVLTRRAELARRPEEIVTVEHPWRAAILRWRRDLAAKAQAYANGASTGASRVQPVSEPSEAATAENVQKDAPPEKPAAPSPGPRPVPRLSAVQSEPAAEEKTEAKTDDPAAEKPAPAKRKPAKAAAKKTGPQRIEKAQEDVTPAEDESPAEAKNEAKTEATPDPEPTIELEATTELEASAEAEAKADADAEVEPEPAEERERPAAPG